MAFENPDEAGSRRRLPRWRDLPVRYKGLIVVALPVGALMLAVGVFFVVDHQNRRATDAVARTLHVQTALEEVLILVLDAETGGRGYLLTGDEDFLVPLEDARRAMPKALSELLGFVGDDPEQQARIEDLEALIERRLAISELTTRFGPDDFRSPALLETLDEGRESTDAIRSAVAAIAAIQEARLEDRQADADLAQERGVLSAAVALLAGLAGAVVAVMLHSRGVSRRLGDLRRDAELLARGEPAQSVPDGGDEIGILGRSLQQARLQLDEREATLRDRESRLQAILDASPDIIAVFDATGSVRLVNHAIHTVLGYTQAERAATDASDVIHPEDIDRFLDGLGRVAAGEDTDLVLRYRARHASGEWVDIEARGRAIADANPDGHDVLMVAREISAQVRLEIAQQHATDAAESANRSKSEFLSHMSHELRTPLNAVLGFAQVLELDDLDDDQRESVDHILKAGRHLLALINEVLDISRIDAGEMTLSPEPVHVGDLVAETLELIGPLAAERSITIRGGAPGNCDLHALADRQRTKQVLLNLLSNAVKYNRPAGTISIRCDQNADSVAVSIIDTGYGIRPELQHMLFTPFERLDASTTDIEGTGIGLALSRRLTEAMGGTVELNATSGHGSTFVVQLPRVESPDDRHDRLAPSRVAAATLPSSSTSGAVHTIVHVEDNLSNLRLIERILAPRDDIRLVATMQGSLALDLIREHQPVLVLLDVHLADVNGDEVLRQLVEDPTTSSIPVIMLSADATQRQIQRLLGAGAYAYLTKPVDVRQLIATIDAILDDSTTS